MADTEETSAQRQARIRREKRETKILSGGTERLDKITRLSGRTPESVRSGVSTPPGTPPTSLNRGTAQPRNAPPSPAPPQIPNLANAASPAQVQAQEDYLRSLLRMPEPQQGLEGQQAGNQMAEDPMMKMMQQILGGLPGGEGLGSPDGGPSMSPDDLLKQTGLPPFLTNMLLGKSVEPPTPAQAKAARIWKTVHAVFALLVSFYAVVVLRRSVAAFAYSPNPPAPATVQNPFWVFVLGEAMVQGAKVVLPGGKGGNGGARGLGGWLQIWKDIAADGCVVVFVVGLVQWWMGGT